jgi:predicted DNA-binding protein with PD1-like motif
MPSIHNVRSERILMGRLDRGSDLLGEFIDICVQEKIHLGRVEAIGAVSRARLGFYHQEGHEYRHYAINQPLEISALQGNISLKGGNPFVHAHVVLSGIKGRSWGGHLASGTEVYACEFMIEVFSGPELSRVYDRETGLHLWSKREEG